MLTLKTTEFWSNLYLLQYNQQFCSHWKIYYKFNNVFPRSTKKIEIKIPGSLQITIFAHVLLLAVLGNI